MTGTKRGAIYCAVGTKYIDQCAVSAISLRQHNQSMGAAIFTDQTSYARENFSHAFTEILEIAPDAEALALLEWMKETRKLPSLKVLICDRSPFEQTLSIDGDTLVLGSLDEAFDRLKYFKLLACEECLNAIGTVDGHWAAVGLVDTERRGYANAGVLFYDSADPAVQRFMENWKLNLLSSDSPVPVEMRSNDQDVLNYMMWNPSQFCADITFSIDELKAANYNCYCRMWMEIWEASKWNEVRIIHTWMSTTIASMSAEPDFSWSTIFSASFGQFAYINQFLIGGYEIARGLRRLLHSGGRYGLTPFQRLLHEAEMRLMLPNATQIDEISISLHAGYSRFENKPCADVLEEWILERGGRPVSLLKIGVDHSFCGMGTRNQGARFRRGNDLLFFRNALPCRDILALIRYRFLKVVHDGIATRYVEYNRRGEMARLCLPFVPNLLVDDDIDVSTQIRIENFCDVMQRYVYEGIGLFFVSEDLKGSTDRIAQRLCEESDRFQILSHPHARIMGANQGWSLISVRANESL
ncbi:hypothetical protein [Methylosinus sp. LW4]|uniref:hypothetical protein n=1 Tax=Methylosinus sp. LW4 TaxID=136993 RepID=UPI0003AA0041|nr:hypothetical protein [Methylosinus sp. LW4]